MDWVQHDDGTWRATDGDRLHIVRREHVPYPKDAPPGLALQHGGFWMLESWVDGRPFGHPRRFDNLADAKRAAAS
ncbi:hypothetical protein [Mycobacterium sp. SMC-4]|uniref:hypothetical protein n=1 Tax=Mycobacterium sp. SMC-4 TaxID=2857059 RepID=UPI0021B1B653|nr:hypothetical protein [Mycobacterium sp. SMC-4]UXA16972.1 hypothetical protein KXD98_19745 [Mycobacterium sp. SMC-4]